MKRINEQYKKFNFKNYYILMRIKQKIQMKNKINIKLVMNLKKINNYILKNKYYSF